MCDIFLYKGPQKGLHEDINLETIASTETLRGMFYEFQEEQGHYYWSAVNMEESGRR